MPRREGKVDAMKNTTNGCVRRPEIHARFGCFLAKMLSSSMDERLNIGNNCARKTTAAFDDDSQRQFVRKNALKYPLPLVA